MRTNYRTIYSVSVQVFSLLCHVMERYVGLLKMSEVELGE